MSTPSQVGVDVGGTFTDVVLVAEGTVTTAKVPTTDDQSVGVVHGIDVACKQAGVEPANIKQFRHAMTVATNAMLEDTGAKTALVTTAGFRDVLEIGRQDRPALYDHSVKRPEPLVPAERRYELDERATPDGIETPVDPDDVRDIAASLNEPESVAISFLHAYATPENEKVAADVLREELDIPVVASHETLTEFREYERTSTTVVDAYVTPTIAAYLDHLTERAADRHLDPPAVMQSNGGITDSDTLTEHAVTTVLSGPAAGVVGASLFESGHDGIITFDMGGTSSDVGLVCDGDIERTSEATIAGYPVHVPMVDIETVGAGGGSIAWVDDGGALRVGPKSAGAKPGPACYGHGGDKPTVTDANLVLGYLGADTELGEGLTLDKSVAHDVVSDLATEADLTDAVAAARGVHRVANATMARTIRTATVERGDDPREFGLVAFGGAGPMHAATLAADLGIESVRVPRASGVLSALGLLAADERHDSSRTFRGTLADLDNAAIEERYTDLEEAVGTTSTTDGLSITRQADLRYAGQSYELTIDISGTFDRDAVEARFHDAHERVRGYRLDEKHVELVTLRVTGSVSNPAPELAHNGKEDMPVGSREAFFDGEFRETPVYDRMTLAPETAVDGPALFEGGESTVVLPPGWTATVDDAGTLHMHGTQLGGNR
ncbi:hydantoinase/oxoprolinase family protein [Halovenus rubra]|uniref:Hydantoinase/oxoprolinase family protein n=2 Tax=Halovenus rubra TaxID=869890 RepID=A0ACC7E220_9EURY|nr:hydantoinase/oxoprolinase family protein [Halovenus rubra]